MIQEPQRQNRPPWPVINDDNLDGNQGPGETIDVRCIAPEGIYYNYRRRREGDVFTLMPRYITETQPAQLPDGKPNPRRGEVIKENGQPKKKLLTARDQFSERTMELVEGEHPHTTSAQEAINQKQDELTDKTPSRRRSA